jgi:hypothetical protein
MASMSDNSTEAGPFEVSTDRRGNVSMGVFAHRRKFAFKAGQYLANLCVLP